MRNAWSGGRGRKRGEMRDGGVMRPIFHVFTTKKTSARDEEMATMTRITEMTTKKMAMTTRMTMACGHEASWCNIEDVDNERKIFVCFTNSIGRSTSDAVVF